MILDSIALNNFGIYGGSQSATLSPAKNRPIVLVGGLNGGGKTTFLDAIHLVLYGAKAPCSGRGKLAYRDYLRDMIHRGADPKEGASIELNFQRAVDGNIYSYKLTRSWWQSDKGIEERVQVYRDSELDLILSEHWDEYIESYIPSGIANLFFFDAEQIKELAEGEHSAEIVGTAINSLLGLDLVDRLGADLTALDRRKRALIQSPQQAEKTRVLQEDADALQTLLDQVKQDQGVLGNELGRLRKDISACEEKFRQEGGELFLRRSELEAQRASLENELKMEEQRLRDLAAGAAPFMLIPKLLRDTEKLAAAEATNEKAAVLASALELRDKKILKSLKAGKLPKQSLAIVEYVLKEDRTNLAQTVKQPLLLNEGEYLATELRHFRHSVLPELKKAIAVKLNSIVSLKETLARADVSLARVPKEDAIAHLQTELSALREKQKQKERELAANEEKVAAVMRQIEDAKRKLEQELNREIDLQTSDEHNVRILKHSKRVQETLSKFRNAVVRQHASRLESLIMESFAHLLRKRNLITSLSIDPTTFRIELTAGDGKNLPFDRLSAGERQLLATSLIWGLAKASGRPLPTIIDTPLGRLDSSHRGHLMDRYFPVASHQVILLSTDKEIDQESFDKIKPHLARSYRLSFNETNRTTTIEQGYFWEQ